MRTHGARRVGHALAVAAVTAAAVVAPAAMPVVLAGPAAATTPTGPATPAPPPTGPPTPPPCANAVQVVTGTVTSAATPLPVPVSTVGGARLSAQGVQVATPPGTPAPPVLPAAGWLVADLTSGAVLASCNAHVPFMPASTLKVLTALALRPKIDLTSTYVALPADAAIDGTKVGLSPGSTYTGDDLFHGLLMSSGNDAANALADLAGGATTASALMTAEARRLGAFDTVAVNTSGLDAPGQVSSVYDLALLGRAALAQPYLAKVMATRTYPFPGKGVGSGPKRKRYQIQNHNRLLGSYPGATGVKNGYTVAAGGSFVGSATRGGRGYLVTVLRADGRTSDMARSLLDWAFTAGAGAGPVGRLVTAQDVATGLAVDPGVPPTATPSLTPLPTTTGPVVPTSPVPTASPGSTLDAAGTASGEGGSTEADAWAAGLVLGAVAAFGVSSAVLVLRRARTERLHGGTIVPGLLLERLSRLRPSTPAAPTGKAFPELADDSTDAGTDNSTDNSDNTTDASTDGASDEARGGSSAPGGADDGPDRPPGDA
jgi:D-alanyl-D-alanine carboxypeptidase (penicillin-binding protein 5/6)